MDILLQFITIERVTFWIAIAGFVLSLTSWIKEILVNRKNLRANILELHAKDSAAFLRLMINNKSRLPISISGINLVTDFQQCPCTTVPKYVTCNIRFIGGKQVSRSEEYSTALPIQISGLGGTNALVLFEGLPREIPCSSKYLTLVIYTNRGNPEEMTLELPEDWSARSGKLLH